LNDLQHIANNVQGKMENTYFRNVAAEYLGVHSSQLRVVYYNPTLNMI